MIGPTSGAASLRIPPKILGNAAMPLRGWDNGMLAAHGTPPIRKKTREFPQNGLAENPGAVPHTRRNDVLREGARNMVVFQEVTTMVEQMTAGMACRWSDYGRKSARSPW